MRIGTRGSALALAQAHAVADALGGGAEVIVIKTRGDVDRAAPDKEKWVAELERALLDGEVDVAVHSAKDVPTSLPEGLVLAGALPREDPSDALVGAASLDDVAAGARIGTAALRRAAQIRARRTDVEIVEVRGNVDTRLGKLADGEVDALVLAEAGLQRLGRTEPRGRLDTVSAAGQGVVVLETRADFDGSTLPRDDAAWRALLAERACVRGLGADCMSAVGAHAVAQDGGLRLRAWAGAVDGSAWVADELSGSDPESLGAEVARRMLAAGAGEFV